MAIPPNVVSGQPIAASWGNAVVAELQRQVDTDNSLNTKIDNNWGAQNNWNIATRQITDDHENRIAWGNINGQLRGGNLLIQGGGGTYATDGNGAFSIVFPSQFAAGSPVACVVNNIVQSFPIVSYAFDIRQNLTQVMNRWISANAPGEPFVNSSISVSWIAIGWRI